MKAVTDGGAWIRAGAYDPRPLRATATMTTDAAPPGEPGPAQAETTLDTVPESPIAGFWLRLGAFAVDSIVLGGVGMLIGLVAMDALVRMGGWARLIGLVIVLAYAGVLNSRLGGGKTFGKRLVGIRVTGLDGGLLSLPRTFVRQLVFATPFFLNGAPIDVPVLVSMLAYPLSLALFGGLFAILYLAVFNRRNRRSLHDLAAGSVVVLAPGPARVLPIAPTWRGHLVVVSVVALLALLAPVATQRLAKSDTFAGLMPLQAAMDQQPGVLQAQVTRGETFFNGEHRSDYLAVTLYLDHPGIDDEAFARQAARKAVATIPGGAQVDTVVVQLVYGYDMVIASAWRKQSYSFAPAELVD